MSDIEALKAKLWAAMAREDEEGVSAVINEAEGLDKLRLAQEMCRKVIDEVDPSKGQCAFVCVVSGAFDPTTGSRGQGGVMTNTQSTGYGPTEAMIATVLSHMRDLVRETNHEPFAELLTTMETAFGIEQRSLN